MAPWEARAVELEELADAVVVGGEGVFGCEGRGCCVGVVGGGGGGGGELVVVVGELGGVVLDAFERHEEDNEGCEGDGPFGDGAPEE